MSNSPYRRINREKGYTVVRDYDGSMPYAKFEYSSGDLLYMGTHVTHGEATSSEDWTITKYTYGSDGIDLIEKLVGAWDDRGSLAWD